MKNVKPLNFSCEDFPSPGDAERSLVLRGLSKLVKEVGEKGVNGEVGLRGDSGDNGSFALIGLLESSFVSKDLTSDPGLLRPQRCAWVYISVSSAIGTLPLSARSRLKYEAGSFARLGEVPIENG